MADLQANTVADHVVVSLDYTLTVDGKVIDSTAGSSPLEYLQGHHNILSGLERALAGLGCGETKQVFLPAKDAYGQIDPQAFVEIEKAQFPPNFQFEIGRDLRVQDDEGRIHVATICAINADNVRLDLNHPLAGKDLLFQATVVSLRAPTHDELDRGRIGGCSGCSSSDCGSGDCH
jgi:FKBP-type peptidyl-prolyl cis-trans isomerase SlyD